MHREDTDDILFGIRWILENGQMTKREAFAMAAMQWEPPTDEVEFQERCDRNRNPYNEPHKPRLRDRHEIVAALQLRRADAMLQALKETP